MVSEMTPTWYTNIPPENTDLLGFKEFEGHREFVVVRWHDQGFWDDIGRLDIDCWSYLPAFPTIQKEETK